MSKALEDIAAEYERQRTVEGWTEEHDDKHADGTMALAAACYASPVNLYEKHEYAAGISYDDPWPWEDRWDKRRYNGNVLIPNEKAGVKQRRRHLVKAAALLAAEIDKMDRARASDVAA